MLLRPAFPTSWCVCIGVVLGGAAVLGVSPTPPPDTMLALITVLAPASGPVTDLSPKDFTVREGKRTIDVTAADLATQPLSIELLVDNSQPSGIPPPTADLRTALDGFVQAIRAGDPNAKIGMYLFAGASIPSVKLGAPAGDLDAAIAHLIPAPQPTGALIEALTDASHELAEQPAPRRAIVSIDVASAESTPDTAARNADKTVYQTGATVWAISVTSALKEMPKRDIVLEAVTRRTGGERLSIAQASGLPTQLKAIANSLLSQYTIQFARPSGQLQELAIQTPKGKALATMFAQ